MGGPDIAVTAISGASTIALAWIAKTNRDIRVTANENQSISKRIEARTNGELDAKIRKAVTEVFAEHKTEVTEAVMAESVRHLLDAMLSEGTYPRGKQ